MHVKKYFGNKKKNNLNHRFFIPNALIYSKEHYTYNKHSCSLSNARQMTDFQVPLCPLCSQPVPHKRNQLPDITMSAHIDRDCKSDPAEVNI